jgi:GT2 family glycosyltransferase
MGISLALRTSRISSQQPSLILNKEIICRHNDNQSPEVESTANSPNVEYISFTSNTWGTLNVDICILKESFLQPFRESMKCLLILARPPWRCYHIILLCFTHVLRPILLLLLPLRCSGQSFWLQIQKFRIRFPALPDFLRGRGLELSLARTIEELLE